jgi:sporulation protein YlmC with PRC-barrel domain
VSATNKWESRCDGKRKKKSGVNYHHSAAISDIGNAYIITLAISQTRGGSLSEVDFDGKGKRVCQRLINEERRCDGKRKKKNGVYYHHSAAISDIGEWS